MRPELATRARISRQYHGKAAAHWWGRGTNRNAQARQMADSGNPDMPRDPAWWAEHAHARASAPHMHGVLGPGPWGERGGTEGGWRVLAAGSDGPRPPPRCHHTTTLVGLRLLLMGGTGTHGVNHKLIHGWA